MSAFAFPQDFDIKVVVTVQNNMSNAIKFLCY